MRTRRALAGYAAFFVVTFAVARGLEPSARGVGTHEQLGLPPCPVLALAGIPCPACGMTTAFALAARGRVVDAFAAQPFGAALAFALAALFVFSLATLARPERVGRLLDRALAPAGLWAIAVFFVLAWAYKIAALANSG